MKRWASCRNVVRGHTLLEMMLSLVLLTVVMASVTSAVIFASSAKPDEASAEATLAADSQVLAQIAEDLSLARYVTERTASSVAIVVSDRTGDGNPDRIRYAWSGKAGEGLTYQLNDEPVITLLDAVSVFSLTYAVDVQSTQLPVASYPGDGKILDSFTTTTSPTNAQLRQGHWFGQVLTFNLSRNAHGFMPQQVDLYSAAKPPTDGVALLQLRAQSNGVPGGAVFGQSAITEHAMSSTANWHTFQLADTAFVQADQDLALTLNYISGGNAVMCLLEQSNGGLLGLGGGTGGHLTSRDGATWSVNNGKSLIYRVHGYEYLYDVDRYTITRERLNRITVTLQSGADGRSPVQRAVRMMLSPTMLDAFAESGFDGDPTGVDVDNNKVNEWTHDSGQFPTASIGDGVWTAKGQLLFSPSDLSRSDVITIAARMRSNDTLGPTIHGPYTVNDSRELLPIQTQLRRSSGGGQELVIYNDIAMQRALLVIPGLPTGFVDVRLTVIPDENYLYVAVNNQPKAALLLKRVPDTGTIRQAVRLGSSGGVSEFDSVYIKAGGGYTTAASEEGQGHIDGLLDLLVK